MLTGGINFKITASLVYQPIVQVNQYGPDCNTLRRKYIWQNKRKIYLMFIVVPCYTAIKIIILLL